MRIIVVGAGVAGLTAAGRLAAQGHEVVVVEGRDRIGGRTFTTQVGAARVDLGASWIHGPLGNPLTDEVRRAGLDVHNDGAWGLGAHVYIEGEGWAEPNEVASSVASRFDFDPNEVIDALGRDGTMAEGADWYVSSRGLQGREARIVDFGIRSLESGLNIGGPADDISLSGAGWYELHSGGNAVIAGGYGRLVDHLATGLDIRLGCPVESIEHAADGGITVHTADGPLHGDQAVLAVPLGVIKRGAIRIDPEPGLAERASRLGVASLEKIVLQFDAPFWSHGTKRLIRISDDRRFPGWNDLSIHTGAPTLVVFHNPRLASTYLDAPDRIPAALEALRQMYGADVPDPVATHSTDWLSDPFAFGSYSYPSIGATAADMAAMGGRLTDRLVGAGEHTVPAHFGTVHAAFISGLRAAAAFG